MPKLDSKDLRDNPNVFKKRTHRPWKPSVLEATDVGSAAASETHAFTDPFSVNPRLENEKPEQIRRLLEQTLELKQNEQTLLTSDLKRTQDNRILIGGFFQPKNIILTDEHEKLTKTHLMMNELKQKEQEILQVTYELKITKAQEMLDRAEMARLAEEEARKGSEEKALFAIQQARHAAELIEKSEKETALERQARFETEQRKKELEEKLIAALRSIEILEHAKKETELAKQAAEEKAKYAIDYAMVVEDNAKKAAEEKVLKIEALATEQLHERDQRIQFAQLEAEKQVEKAIEQLNLAETGRIKAMAQAHEARETIHALEAQVAHLTNGLNTTVERLKKTDVIIETERNLRRLYDGKTKEALRKAEETEMLRRTEEAARLEAEDKINRAIEHASQSVLNVLSN